jgi:hypothetical protein
MAFNIPVEMRAASSFVAYYRKLLNGGLAEGAPGSMKFPADVREVVTALHRVLAGGKVTITVTRPGSTTEFDTMEALLKNAEDEINALNTGGYYVLWP